MNFTYKKAGISDLNLLVKTRIQVLRAANLLEATEAGRPLYENFGFVSMPDEMMLPETFFIE